MSLHAQRYASTLKRMLDRRANFCKPCEFNSRDGCPGWYWPDIPCPKGVHVTLGGG